MKICSLVSTVLLMMACGQVEVSDTDRPIIDNDNDGFVFSEDCNDSDDQIYPGAPESCEEPLIDSNCDGITGGLDEDEDGFVACDDCDDGDDMRFPNANEICDGVDNDCDGLIDDEDDDVDLSTTVTYYVDGDGDGYGDEAQPIVQCVVPETASEVAGDCNDDDELVNPAAEEICDLQDNNCDGLADRDDPETTLSASDPMCYPDSDEDGFGDLTDGGLHTCYCLTDESDNNKDCNDDDDIMHPDQDFLDQPAGSGAWDLNCDGVIEGLYTEVEAFCSLGSGGRSCDFGEGFLTATAPPCGEEGTYLTACTAIKVAPSGMACEAVEESRTQSCR